MIYADEVNYWKTSQGSPEAWLEKTKRLIESIGGNVDTEMIATQGEKTAIMLGFSIGEDNYKIIYPTLAVRNEKERISAKRQAATALYYEVKTLVVSAKFRGVRGAFLSYLVLPDGRRMEDLSSPELLESAPKIFRLNNGIR